MNDFFYQNMNPLNEALSTGNLVQTIKLWIGFLEKCANDAQKIIQEFDDMFD